MLTALLALHVLAAPPDADPFAFLQPSVVVSQDDRRQLAAGQPTARVIPSQGREVAVFAAVPADIGGDRLVAWMRRIEELKKSPYVLAIGRFSNPPQIEDLAGLSLDDEELSAIQGCRPGSCGLKLSAAEMAQLQRAAREAGTDWKPALQQAFRGMLLARVQAYLVSGHDALEPFEDHDNPVSPAARFRSILGNSIFLRAHLPALADSLGGGPAQPAPPHSESFVYWSKEHLAGKANISATDVKIVRSGDPTLPDVVVAAKEIFSTHYVSASLGVTALMRDQSGARSYLVYVNRSEVDVIGGTFGGILRWILQRRLKSESASVLVGLRRRLESGEPPPARPLPANGV